MRVGSELYTISWRYVLQETSCMAVDPLYGLLVLGARVVLVGLGRRLGCDVLEDELVRDIGPVTRAFNLHS